MTRDRLYIDAMEEVLGRASKVLLDVQGGNQMLYLPLDKIVQGRMRPPPGVVCAPPRAPWISSRTPCFGNLKHEAIMAAPGGPANVYPCNAAHRYRGDSFSLASDAVFVMKETERAVLLRFGALETADIAPGLHFKMPFADEVTRFDGRILTLDSETQRYFPVDKTPLNVDSYVKWRIKDVALYYTATSGDERNASDRLAERVRTGLRNEFSRRDVYEVVSGQRDELMDNLTASLSEVMQTEFGVEVIDVRVKRIELPGDVSSSVFQRMSAEEVLAREIGLGAGRWPRGSAPTRSARL